MAQEIAIETTVGIRRILDPAQVRIDSVLLDGGTIDVQQRTSQPARFEAAHGTDAGNTSRTAAANQVEQQGFRLVLAMMRTQQPIPALHLHLQSRVAGFASRCLRPLTRLERYRNGRGMKIHTKLFRETCAMLAPAYGIGL